MDDWLESFPDVDEQEKREFVPPTITDGKPEITEAQDVYTPSETVSINKSTCEYAFYQKKFKEARELYIALQKTGGKHLTVREKYEISEAIILCNFHLKEYEAALSLILTAASPTNPETENLWFLGAKIHKILGHNDERLSCLRQCIVFHPSHILAWYTIGKCYLNNGKKYWSHLAFKKTLFYLTREGYFKNNFSTHSKGTSQYDKVKQKIHSLIEKTVTEDEETEGMSQFEIENLLRVVTVEEDNENEDTGASLL